MGLFVESADRPYTSRQGAEELHVGTLATTDSNGMFVNADAQDNRLDYLVTKPMSEHHIVEDVDDPLTDQVYEANSLRVPALPLVDGDIVKAMTIEETTDGVTSSPNIQAGDIVGVTDTSDADSPDSAGRLVEEGYSNDENDDATATTFSRANGNFLALGEALRDSETDFDKPVRVQVNRENLQ
jgi:hypothetical protein